MQSKALVKSVCSGARDPALSIFFLYFSVKVVNEYRVLNPFLKLRSALDIIYILNRFDRIDIVQKLWIKLVIY